MTLPARYVQRYEANGFNGWRYLCAQRAHVAAVQAYFSVREHGSLELALLAANAFAQAQAQQLPLHGTHMRPARGQFAFVGVSFHAVRRNAQGEVTSAAWVATWPEHDRQVRLRFSVAIYGYAQAFLNAAHARLAAVGTQPGLDPYSPPPWPEPPSAELARAAAG